MHFSSDGRYFIAGGGGGRLSVWEVDEGSDRPNLRELHSFLAHGADVTRVDFLPGSSRFITAASDRYVKFWDLVSATGGVMVHELGSFRENGYPINSFAMSPDGRKFVTVGGYRNPGGKPGAGEVVLWYAGDPRTEDSQAAP